MGSRKVTTLALEWGAGAGHLPLPSWFKVSLRASCGLCAVDLNTGSSHQLTPHSAVAQSHLISFSPHPPKTKVTPILESTECSRWLRVWVSLLLITKTNSPEESLCDQARAVWSLELTAWVPGPAWATPLAMGLWTGSWGGSVPRDLTCKPGGSRVRTEEKQGGSFP